MLTKRTLMTYVLGIGVIVGVALWAFSATWQAPSAHQPEIADDHERILELIARRNQPKAQLIPRYQSPR